MNLPETPQDNHTTPPKRTSALSITALICALLIIPTLGITALPAIIFGKLANKNINKIDNNLKGGGIATLAIYSGALAILCFSLYQCTRLSRPFHNHNFGNLGNIRSIGQTFAANANSNKGWWPGYNGRVFTNTTNLTFNGKKLAQAPDGSHPSARLALLLHAGEIDEKSLISPHETNTNIQRYDYEKPFSSNNSSYAMLHLGTANPKTFIHNDPAPQRLMAWNNSNSSSTPVISDRNISADNTKPKSNFNKENDNKPWKGHVQFADTHVEFLQRPDPQRTTYGDYTKKVSDQLYETSTYGPGPTNTDNLFTNEDQGKDALLIHKLKAQTD